MVMSGLQLMALTSCIQKRNQLEPHIKHAPEIYKHAVIQPVKSLVSLATTFNLKRRGSDDCAYSELFCDKILSCPVRFEILNLLLSNALLAARVHIAGPAWFAVTCDVF